jgi:hypothetical protein
VIANLQTRPVLVAAPLDEDRHPSPPEETAGPASAREYRIIYVARPMAGSPHEAIESDLNKAAQEGWRLVSALANEEGRTTGLILERERATTDGCASA